MISQFEMTRVNNQVQRLVKGLKKQGEAIKDEEGLEVLAEMSRQEIRKWLRMKPSEMNRLTNKEVYNLLSKLLPELEETQKHLAELDHIFHLLGDTSLDKRMKSFNTHILQFNDILVAAITAPATRYAEVIDILKKRYPKMAGEINRLIKRKTSLVTRLLKTTTEKLKSGNKEKFPIKKYKPTRMRMTGKFKVASILGYFQSLYEKSQEALKEAWEQVKESLKDVFSGFLSDVDSVDEELVALSDDLKNLV